MSLRVSVSSFLNLAGQERMVRGEVHLLSEVRQSS
jgi:hypothetical protein